MAILKSHFGDPQVVIQSNIDIFLALHPTSSSSNINDLRKIYDKVETVSRNLQRFEVHAEHFGPILIAVLMENLPSDFRLQVSRNMPQGKWEISKLLDEFEKELLSRERINILNSDNPNPAPPLFSGSTLHLQAQKGQPKTNQISCTYCKQNHPSNKCSVVTDVQARKQILINKTRCFNCLRVGHVVKNCTKPQKCYICQGKHHISICNSKIQNPKSNDSRNPPKNVPPNSVLNKLQNRKQKMLV